MRERLHRFARRLPNWLADEPAVLAALILIVAAGIGGSLAIAQLRMEGVL